MLTLPLSILLALSISTGPALAADLQLPDQLVPLGHTVGVKLFSDGVIVVGLSKIQTDTGTYSPATKAGIEVGDVITHIGSQKVNTAESVQNAIKTGEITSLRIIRDGKNMQVELKPARSETDNAYKLGIWVRDSMAGIGTLTFYDPLSGMYGALGHGVSDVDTQMLMPLLSGSIMDSVVTSVTKGETGNPGELNGQFNLREDCGTITKNSETGIFGFLSQPELFVEKSAVEVASRDEIKTGNAVILSNINGDSVKQYDVEIIHVYPEAQSKYQNLMIRVTDPELLASTGGIVQGMSGSPILQNGKLVGAVTHVLVNDPTRGYGILINNMINHAFMAKSAIAA